MAEQMKFIDYNSRSIKFIEKADEETMGQILGIIDSTLEDA